MRLRDALRLDFSSKIALTGSGGKTSALFLLAQEFLGRAGVRPDACGGEKKAEFADQVLLAATTHMSVSQTLLADHHYILTESNPPQPEMLAELKGSILFTGIPTDRERVFGISLEDADSLCNTAEQLKIPLLFEADGSRQRPLKAPAAHEPVVPAGADAVVVVAGLSGIGQPCSSERVFREDRFAELAEIATGDLIQVEQIARVLNHPEGGLKGCPTHASRIALLTQLKSDSLRSSANRLAQALIPNYRSIILADLANAPELVRNSESSEIFAVHERTAGIILAAGSASRYGLLKQIMDFRGKPLARYAVEAALNAGLSPVVVVIGNQAEKVQNALSSLPVEFTYNPDWESGQSSSVRAGVQGLDPAIGAAIFLLADQPFVTPELLKSLVENHAESLYPIVAPLVDGQRANPVLFDRCLFTDLCNLSGDSGGRQLFSRCRPTWLPWHDRSILLDIDSAEDWNSVRDSFDKGSEV